MNRVMEAIAEQDRSVNWCAIKIGVTRQGMGYKIEHNVFDDEQKNTLSEALRWPLAKLFPEYESIAQEVADA